MLESLQIIDMTCAHSSSRPNLIVHLHQHQISFSFVLDLDKKAMQSWYLPVLLLVGQRCNFKVNRMHVGNELKNVDMIGEALSILREETQSAFSHG